jgi:tetratricopeptide (TPR) repeat protein
LSEIGTEQRRALERAVSADPGAPGFAALAELCRRSGQVSEAEEMLRQGLARKPDAEGGRLVLALCLVDQGRTSEARAELERLAGALLTSHELSAPPAGVSDSEFDAAFEDVETDVGRIVDPNRVAEEAVSFVDGRAGDPAPSLFDALEGSAFATPTMADLLERQGDADGAARIRSAAAAEARSEDDPRRLKERTVATLQRWLANLRGDRS